MAGGRKQKKAVGQTGHVDRWRKLDGALRTIRSRRHTGLPMRAFPRTIGIDYSGAETPNARL
jgi:hypothetical protein